MDKSAEISISSLANEEGINYNMAVLEIAIDATCDPKSGKCGKGYTSFKNMVITKRGKWGTIWSWTAILSLAIAKRHLAICKLIFEQIQDIHPLHKLGNSVLQQAVLFNNKDMCEFIIDKIQDILPDENWRQYLNEIAETSNGHKETCSFIESLIKKYK